MQNIQEILPLYFVAGTQDCRHLGENLSENLLFVLKQALEGGITCFQFRDKGKFSLEHTPSAQKALAMSCRDLCREYGVPFIVDDNVDLALEIEADGIHVGQSDMPVQEIRAKTDKPLIIGWSVNRLDEANIGENLAEIDYFGIGPIFPTQSKENPKPTLGMAFIQTLRNAGITKPLVAIGGVKLAHVKTLREFGADGVAVITAISQAENVKAATKALREASNEYAK
ncbi:TPA: thiamine phosphate synthase [Haemophilus influenzae]|uniref:thiamine phosphate synthase n=1 Tax=Haemophilus influenzae TaxID=727 RepID=UPI000D00EF53|nr:thiamine phosphate synthase [Haemophilus influenzae]AWP54505.1 thiamine phosphate synthase [Haemophilus influenzae]PRI36340.1 Thiamine-phosphate synthase [Haemophilus influenzae]PRJ54300.1 Thiamine-phosphate synthase [Haemophilus influenzae]PRJ57949.1 Thiamine-phosphate synthase [Haemophilus influenzae]PRM17126.1 Thiamine-phosphate synthase [Haemophilus influenzae]